MAYSVDRPPTFDPQPRSAGLHGVPVTPGGSTPKDDDRKILAWGAGILLAIGLLRKKR